MYVLIEGKSGGTEEPEPSSSEGHTVEIVISAGVVRTAEEAPDTPEARQARAIANLLPTPSLLAKARILHHEDEGYTGIRFDTDAGPVVLMMPVEAGFEYHVVHETDEGPNILRSYPGTLRPQAVAFRFAEYMRQQFGQ